MKETNYKLLIKKIKKYKNIIILKHIRPDWDAQGSSMGLAYLIQENFPGKTIVVPGDRLDDNKDFLKSKISNDFIKSALVITVDTATKSRLDFDKYDIAVETFKIDHHVNIDPYAKNEIVKETAMACTEVITLWADAMKLKWNANAASNLYKGLVTDSGRFLFPNTSFKTFNAAKILLENGANLKAVHDSLFVSDLKRKQYANFAFSKLQLSKKGVGHITITKEDQKPWKYSYEQIKSALGTMSGIDEIKIWVLVIELDEEIKVSIRSRDFEIDKVANKYDGGGHKLASGCKLNTLSDISKLVKDLDAVITKGNK
ncbi:MULTISPECIES: DHH family phosphoesterase [Mesoplasma]|uniref:Bifunctional oligoribonuclease/PAP phosphatase NrnA n=1 Tax=Mesoplasma florum TaxID=2151 RepID=A0A2R3P898_MESFO|nr:MULTISPECIES: bifunctional oligoribonuclease/PAP phosphatase NrnA [Mesoplasma]AVN64005.1 bifunctional oligoribonuclease/PAP phosphatase NrnA [Mesoplasma florum]AVN64691.1 bifunctional oligoribonuclease/PAP phosphatase NrnA [Mesoplasma florum]